MIEEGTETAAAAESPWRRRLFWPAMILSVFLLVLVVLWTQRTPIADNLISREMLQRGVTARYDIASIGLRTQRIENLVLGDRNRPDLTARWVEIDIAVSGLTPTVKALRAGGVRLRGSYKDGQLSLGELDKFRDPEAAGPFQLPDLRLTLDDARMLLETPAGPVGLKLDGGGHLQSGFAGKLAAVMPVAAVGQCRASGLTAYADFSVASRQPRLRGPIRASGMDCRGFVLKKPAMDLDMVLDEKLSQWRGKAQLAANSLGSGEIGLAAPGGDISFAGTLQSTEGSLHLGADALAIPSLRSGRMQMQGRYRAGIVKGGGFARLEGRTRLDQLQMRGDNPVAKLRQATEGTPLEPLARKLISAVDAAGRANNLRAVFRLQQQAGKGGLQIASLAFRSRSGARADLASGSRLGWSWPEGRLTLGGSLRLAGGGFPEAAIRLEQDERGGALSGQIFMEDYKAGGARLGLTPVRFVASGRGDSRFTTLLSLSGPLPGGALEGLTVPIEGRVSPAGHVQINDSCTPVGFAAAKYQSLSLGRGRLQLCPSGTGALFVSVPERASFDAELRAPRLKGRIGQSPLTLAADRVRLSLPGDGFAADRLKIALGDVEAPTILHLAQLAGRFDPGGLGGEMKGAEGRIGNVPLLMSEAVGKWRFVGGKLKVAGRLRLSDAATPGRFNPLDSEDFSLTLENGRIAADGTLLEPRTKAAVVRTRLVHDLGSGAGAADLIVDELRFDSNLQPDDVTRVALGVIANVQGVVAGKGRIRWDRNGVTSEGRFHTDNMDLAAAFGPVSGLSGEIHFSDLLGLQTPPGQVLRLASVNPGIEAAQGVIRYQLLPGQRAQIESGAWPFAGGQLTLEPTVLDFSAEKPRYLTFRIIGLQAAAFINQLELENISATGTFDGLLPMIFDDSGGRILGGVMVARQEGLPALYVTNVKDIRVECDPKRQAGTLAYVGQVSNADLGVFGKLAFDALKSLRYKCLTILMDGNLDGEIVTRVSFNGVNQDPGGIKRKGFFSEFIGLPFIFNIRIEAPFRGLLNTAMSFTDPSRLIRNNLGANYVPVTENRLAVQPAESENMPTGDK